MRPVLANVFCLCSNGHPNVPIFQQQPVTGNHSHGGVASSLCFLDVPLAITVKAVNRFFFPLPSYHPLHLFIPWLSRGPIFRCRSMRHFFSTLSSCDCDAVYYDHCNGRQRAGQGRLVGGSKVMRFSRWITSQSCSLGRSRNLSLRASIPSEPPIDIIERNKVDIQ